MRGHVLIAAFAAVVAVACTPREVAGDGVVARLGNATMSHELLQEQWPTSSPMAEADSVLMAERLITQWALEQLLVQAAEFNLDEELEDVEALVAKYRRDLLKHAYVERYISQHLDTVITEEEIQEYYQANLDNFELKESIVQGRYVAAPVSARDVERAKRWFVTDPQGEKFLEWAEVFASKQSYFADSAWMPLDDFVQEIPLESSNPYSYMSRNSRFTCEDTVLVYFVEVQALMIKDSYSPIEYVSGKIEKVLLNKRRLELIARVEENMIKDAIEEGKLILY